MKRGLLIFFIFATLVSIAYALTTPSISISSASGNDYYTDDLTATVTPVDNSTLKNIINWKKDGTSITVLNMPFEGHTGSEGSTALDYSPYGNSGTVDGADWSPTAGYDGFGAYSYVRLSTDKISLGDLDVFESTEAISLHAWIKMSTSGEFQWIISNEDNSGNSGYNLFVRSSDIPSFETRNATSGGNVNGITNVSDGAWHNLVGTYNGTVSKIFVDGVLEGTTNYTGGIGTNTNPLLIGTRGFSPDTGFYSFDGQIDEVLIFNTSISDQQVLALYNNRTDLIVSDETSIGDTWQACATANDGTEDSAEACSNIITIQGLPIPEFSTIALFAILGLVLGGFVVLRRR
jgi:hypothetical protein